WLDEQIASEPHRPGTNRIAYFMTHPLMSTENRPHGREGALSMAHVEKMLLMCPVLEVQNGARTRALNDLTRRMVTSLDPRAIERLANEHDLEAKGIAPWRKGLTGGSDDHSGINPGRTWTEFPHRGRPTANALVDALRGCETEPGGMHGGPVTLAHSLLKLV